MCVCVVVGVYATPVPKQKHILIVVPPAHSHVNIFREIAVGVREEYGDKYRITFGTRGKYLEMARSVGFTPYEIFDDTELCQGDPPDTEILDPDPFARLTIMSTLLNVIYECTYDRLEDLIKKDKPDLMMVDFFLSTAVDLADKYQIEWITVGALGLAGYETPMWYPNGLTGGPLESMHSFSARVNNFYLLFRLIVLFSSMKDSINEPRIARGHTGFKMIAEQWAERLVLVPETWMFHSARPINPNAQLIGFLSPPADSPRAAALTDPLKDKEIMSWLDALPPGARVVYVAFGSHAKLPKWFNAKVAAGVVSASSDCYVLVSSKDLDISAIANEVPHLPHSEIERRVRVEKWVPQRRLLEHPSIALFVSHGGLSSIAESVDAKVPLLIIPFFGDQPRNAFLIQDAGVGLALRALEVTVENVQNLTWQMLSNYEYYRQKVEKLRAVNELCGGRKRAAQLIDAHMTYGSEYLIDAGRRFSVVEKYCLDIIAVVLVVLGLVMYVVWKLCRMVLRVVWGWVFSEKRKKGGKFE